MLALQKAGVPLVLKTLRSLHIMLHGVINWAALNLRILTPLHNLASSQNQLFTGANSI